MRSLARLLLIALLPLAIEACADPYYTIAPIEAWVVDADTGAPIEGAVVTANWQLVGFSYDTGGRKLGQLEVMETVTDKNGRFYFPGFSKVNLSGNVLREEDPQILIFKSGYRYMRWTSDYPIGKEEEQGSYRRSGVNGQKLRMARADSEAKKVAFNLAFLSDYLAVLSQGGNAERIPTMLRVLACERRRLRALDPNIGSIPVPSDSNEVRCENQ